MRFTDLFIRRPILATVVNLFLLLGGWLGFRFLDRPSAGRLAAALAPALLLVHARSLFHPLWPRCCRMV